MSKTMMMLAARAAFATAILITTLGAGIGQRC